MPLSNNTHSRRVFDMDTGLSGGPANPSLSNNLKDRHIPTSYTDQLSTSSSSKINLRTPRNHYDHQLSLSQQRQHDDYRQRSKSSNNPHHISSSSSSRNQSMNHHYNSHHALHDPHHHSPQLNASSHRHSSKSRAIGKGDLEMEGGEGKHSKYHHQMVAPHMYHATSSHHHGREMSEDRRKMREYSRPKDFKEIRSKGNI